MIQPKTLTAGITERVFLTPEPTSLVLLLATLVLMLRYLTGRSPGRLPPVLPNAWPILGHLPSLGLRADLGFQRLGKKHGDIFQAQLGTRNVVVLNSYQALKDGYIDGGDAYNDRPDFYAYQLFSDGGKGTAFADDTPAFRKKRQFVLKVFHHFGIGKAHEQLDTNIAEEARKLVTISKSFNGKPVDLQSYVTVTTLNIICSMVFGKLHDYHDEDFAQVMKSLENVTRNMTNVGVLNVFPFLRHIPAMNSSGREILENKRKIMAFVNQSIAEHRDTFDPDHTRDLVDAYLKETQGNHDRSVFTDEEIAHMAVELMVSGNDASSFAVRWGILFMALNPEIQKKVQREIDDVIDPNTNISISLRQHLPYTHAAILEILRIRPLAPINGRKTKRAVKLRNYELPANTIVLSNNWNILHDPETWSDPETFDPARFLDSDGHVVIPPQFKPFGAGRRICSGQQIAHHMPFVIFTSLMQNFTFKLPEGAPQPDTEGTIGIMLEPQPYKICAVPRH
ncbi:PREDICTED: cytochrome P450 2D9-like [Branchiostoma belcheri]|uniref:Steroid 21-hydroxylase n=1 Tax=Branchiostoma belcheri TaxID=7741 RepID=A0A6P4Z2S4_BRABE|nr:PREDICTED: cytochrome P450 2D9-like [Branchiostoma belcheri]